MLVVVAVETGSPRAGECAAAVSRACAGSAAECAAAAQTRQGLRQRMRRGKARRAGGRAGHGEEAGGGGGEERQLTGRFPCKHLYRVRLLPLCATH